ncbi:unnamed protein product [Thlaspi arvense]|uniref:Uncharacterized protein n=1 Tax=Thlaspi arvense TaxID=13288 RepID=A0AAU9S245_THLAR|nr:unnamed protein product [Thlaspi arvense]
MILSQIMALNFFSASLHPISNPSSSSSSSRSKHKHILLQLSTPPATRVRSERSESGVTDNDGDPSSSYFSGPSSSSSSVRTQLDLLEQLTSTSDGYVSDGGGGGSRGLTVRDQLAGLVGDRDDDFTIPLGKNLKKVSPKFLTISQKRNIKRQTYLNEVSRRNDSVFFATIGAFFPMMEKADSGVPRIAKQTKSSLNQMKVFSAGKFQTPPSAKAIPSSGSSKLFSSVPDTLKQGSRIGKSLITGYVKSFAVD